MTFQISARGLLGRVLRGCLAIVALSGPIAAAQSTGTFIPTGNLNVARIDHTATLLNDGRVLIAGGTTPGIAVLTQISSAEIYDPTTGSFTLTGNMTTSRSGHTATVLLDGRVLITGGRDNAYQPIASAELYDPVTGTFSATGNMKEARGGHVATLLSTGKVLISGSADRSLELYDPATGTFGPTGYVNGSAFGIPAARLLNGDVLLGGYDYGPDAAVYDAMSGNVQALTFPDLVHVNGYSETLLSSGKVLLAGGGTGGYQELGYCCAYLYDPSSQSFQATGSLANPRVFHTATLLPSGLVLIAGGYVGAPIETYYASAELYDPASGTFKTAGAMTTPRENHTATLLRDGRVLLAGGDGDQTKGSTAELYIPDGITPTSACGKYSTLDGLCRRVGILPWYAAIPGQWETDINLNSSVSAVRFGYISSAALTYDGIGHNMLVEASDQSSTATFIAESVGSIQGSYSARILEGQDCIGQFDCKWVPGSGSLAITIDGPNATDLDSASVRAMLKLLGNDGAVLGQADAPVVFTDQASKKWIAAVTDTPLSKQSQPGATIMSFAVANLAAGAQAVNVKVFDTSGSLVGSATTPVLNGAASLGSPFEKANGVGGVYAVALSALLGTDLAPSAGDTVFHGTITFEGAEGGIIAPLVVQMNWPTLTSIPAQPQ